MFFFLVSMSEARQAKRNACLLPTVHGPCFGFMKRYAFNQDKNRCELFTYGGCRGNGNNFKTADECFETCGGDLPCTGRRSTAAFSWLVSGIKIVIFDIDKQTNTNQMGNAKRSIATWTCTSTTLNTAAGLNTKATLAAPPISTAVSHLSSHLSSYLYSNLSLINRK